MALAVEDAEKDSWRLMGVTVHKDHVSSSDQAPPNSATHVTTPAPTLVHKLGNHMLDNKVPSPSATGVEGNHHHSSCPCKEYVRHFCTVKRKVISPRSVDRRIRAELSIQTP